MSIKRLFAKNDIDSRLTFEFRKFYKDRVLVPSDLFRSSHDFWYDEPKYGFIDLKGRPIVPKRSEMSHISEVLSEVKTFDFVRDAFNDLKDHFNRARRIGKLAQQSSIRTLSARSGWDDPLRLYDRYSGSVLTLYQSFLNNDRQENNQVLSFETFLGSFLGFLRHEGFIFSLSSFMESKFVSPKTTGLIVEIATEEYGDDTVKEDRFFLDQNFDFYHDAAVRFGFKLDRNIPWRLVADIGSPVMAEYMESNDISGSVRQRMSRTEDLFNQKYLRTVELEAELLKEKLFGFYFNLIQNEAFIQGIDVRKFRKRIALENISDECMLKFYIKLREIESRADLDSKDAAILLLRKFGVDRAFDFVYRHTRP